MTTPAATASPTAADLAAAIHPPPGLLGRVALDDAGTRARGCSHPVRLTGASVTHTVDRATGELGPIVSSYSSADELDGYTYVRCGNRRAHRCESCSHEYKGDAWHLLTAGLVGGKDVPATVAAHPAVFVTLTAPSYGHVHGRRQRGPCRARRDKPTCPHGRPLWCLARHDEDDARLGTPLCMDCYDYAGHVLWQWHVPELWRRTRIRIDRVLARRLGVRAKDWRDVARLSYTKVGEFQARGLIHFHAIFRLDGPTGPGSPPPPGITGDQLGDAIATAARETRIVVPDPLTPGEAVAIGWGDQLDTRPITTDAGRDDRAGAAHPEQVAAYLGKYLTKSTEEFGIEGRVGSVDAALAQGASEHAVRIIATAADIVDAGGPAYERLAGCFATLGFRGHVITKARTYSTSFGHLRRARSNHRAGRPLDHTDDRAWTIREAIRDADEDDPIPLVTFREWQYAGSGYLELDTAERALISATSAREWHAEHAPALAAP